MQKKREILRFFSKSQTDNYQQELNAVIELSYHFALKYLHFRHRKIANLLLREEITIQELAIDSIAELFSKDGNENVIQLQTAFNKWQPKIKTEEDTLFFLNKIVSGRVEQYVFKLLRDEDPFFSKILDSVNYLIKQNNFYKIQFLGRTFISETENNDFTGKFITSEEFETLPPNLFLNRRQLLNRIFTYLKEETEFNLAIPLNELIYRLKHINFSDYLAKDYEKSSSAKLEIDDFIKTAFDSTLDKLHSSYLAKGKINEQEKTAFINALKEMSVDLCNGGISPGLYGYLSRHIPNLSEENYKEKYHNILEYLLKVMKSKIAEKLDVKS